MKRMILLGKSIVSKFEWFLYPDNRLFKEHIAKRIEVDKLECYIKCIGYKFNRPDNWLETIDTYLNYLKKEYRACLKDKRM